MIIGIVAVDNNWGIGKDNELLFHIKEDMKFFRETTTGHIIVMGHNTLKSFPNGAPLKNRINIVLTSKENIDGCICYHSLNELLLYLNSDELKKEEIYIIGGGTVYNLFLPYYDKVYVTKVLADKPADTFFPNLDKNNYFNLSKSSDIIETNSERIIFTVYEKKGN